MHFSLRSFKILVPQADYVCMKAGSGGYLKGLAGDKGKGIMGVRLVSVRL